MAGLPTVTRLDRLLDEAACARREGRASLTDLAAEMGGLYVDSRYGCQVAEAVKDPFLPLSLFQEHFGPVPGDDPVKAAHRARRLALFCHMYLRIREDIGRFFGNRDVTLVDLGGDAGQDVAVDQWCTLCGRCCRLGGTVPDPPEPIRYPGYWYSYLAGDGPLSQRFCPFLFELPPRGLFFCSIHAVKPRTCLAYGKMDCLERHPGMARG